LPSTSPRLFPCFKWAPSSSLTVMMQLDGGRGVKPGQVCADPAADLFPKASQKAPSICIDVCATCKKRSEDGVALKLCAACTSVQYCSIECQRVKIVFE